MADENKTITPAEPIEQPAPEMPVEPTLPEDALAHDGAEQPAPPPFDLDGKQPPGDNVVDFDSISQKQGAAQESAQEAPAPDIPTPAADPDREAALRREQEALLAEMDQRAASHEKKFSRAPKRNAAKSKAAPAADKRPGRPPKPGKNEKPGEDKASPAAGEQAQPKKPRGKAPATEKPVKTAEPPEQAAPAVPPPPREAPRPDEPEQIVYLNISELHAFKDHPFGVRDDDEMKALAESVREKGVNQPALVRPREDGGYEIIAGHRRQKASELAGFTNMPCIVRDMTDDEAILAMTDDNLRQRSEILPSEKAVSLKMQVDAISHQGARTSGQVGQKEAGQRSVDIVAARNGTSAKQVQRYVKLTDLVPDLLKAVDEKRMGFTTAVEISFIKPRNQNYIAVAMEAEQSAPSLSQAQHLHELDKKGELSGDVIDGILGEKKKEEIKVIITGKELEKYFGNDKTPQQMKEQIVKLLDEWAGKEKEKPAPEKQPER